MFADERPEYEVPALAVAKLVAQLHAKKAGGVVAIDGRFACGKTMLGRYLAWRCGVSLVETDLFRKPAQVRLEYRLDDIRRVLSARLDKKRVTIIDGATSQEILADLEFTPDMVIRVFALDGSDLDKQRAQILEYEARYTRVDIPVHFLPPPNQFAHGLRLTQDEWNRVMQFVSGQPEIKEAWIFGSRATGIRTSKNPPKPSDIDLAIRPNWDWHDEDGHGMNWAIDFRSRHSADLERWGIDLDWHGIGGGSDEWHVKGKRIWPPN